LVVKQPVREKSKTPFLPLNVFNLVGKVALSHRTSFYALQKTTGGARTPCAKFKVASRFVIASHLADTHLH